MCTHFCVVRFQTQNSIVRILSQSSQNLSVAYVRAPTAVLLGAALALQLAATPASRGEAAAPVGPGLARLVRLDRAGFLGAGVQLRRLNRSLIALRIQHGPGLAAQIPLHRHISLSEGALIMYNRYSSMPSAGLPALAKGARNCLVVLLDIATPFLPSD